MALPVVKKSKVTRKGITVYATYSGGPYIELGFGLAGGLQEPQPIEVINVLDYRKSSSDPDRYDPRLRERGGLRKIVVEWVNTVTSRKEGGDPGALARYYENGGY